MILKTRVTREQVLNLSALTMNFVMLDTQLLSIFPFTLLNQRLSQEDIVPSLDSF